MEIDERFYKEEIQTPGWKRFSGAVSEHIEWLKKQENLKPGFKCDCKVCSMTSGLEKENEQSMDKI